MSEYSFANDGLDQAGANLYEKAKNESESGNYLQAARLFRQLAETAVEIARTKRSVFYLLSANAHASAGKYDCALQDCKSAIKIDANSAMAWRCLGSTLLEDELLADAEQALTRSLELQESSTTCVYLSAICKRRGDWERAEVFCRQAIDLSPEFDEAYYNLGLLQQLQGHLDAASRSFLKAITLSPDYFLANRELGAVYLGMGNKVEAQKYLKICLGQEPVDERAKELLRESTT